MTRIANTSGLYNTFKQGFDDPNGYITKLPPETIDHMNRMPPFITEWQAKDIINGEVGEYLQNPMLGIGTAIRDTAKSIVYASDNVTNLTTMQTKAQALADMANTFILHTDRLSGVRNFDGTGDPDDPYLDLAMSYGKTAAYIVYQTDGIDDTSPMMLSFTSLMVEPQLIANNDILRIYSGNVANSIVMTEPNVYTSNLTTQSISTVNAKIDSLKTFMLERQQADIDYYVNLRSFIDKYNEVKRFNRMGNTENNMVQTMIGTPKLLDRLNP